MACREPQEVMKESDEQFQGGDGVTTIGVLEEASRMTEQGNLNRLNPIDSGRYGFMVLSPFTEMSWACARMIQAATTKHGSTSTLSDGMMYNPSVRNLVKGFS